MSVGAPYSDYWTGHMKRKKRRTREAIAECKGKISELRKLRRYTKADSVILAGKKYGGLLDAELIKEALVDLIIEKELLDFDEEESETLQQR